MTALTTLYGKLIAQPAKRWYLRPLNTDLIKLTAAQRQSITRQAAIGWLQTALLIIVIVQVIFAGVLRALPPDLRASLDFLHRIEWAAYLGMILIALQVGVGWADQVVLTNRFYLLAYRLTKPRLLFGRSARYAQTAYIIVIFLMMAATLWVRAHGFIVNAR